jgi:hypothetical protein
LFWVYYPEAREVLARYEYFNEQMMLHPVHGMIYSNNVIFQATSSNNPTYLMYGYPSTLFDENGEDMGVARLMESDRIEAELFNWEHDLGPIDVMINLYKSPFRNFLQGLFSLSCIP